MKDRLRKFLGLVGLGLAVGVSAAFTGYYLVTTVPVRSVGAFYSAATRGDSSVTMTGVGGRVEVFIASDSCRIGNVVYESAKNQVKPSATVVDFNSIAGIVVGGTRTNMQASVAIADTSTLAAIAGERVLVLRNGRYWVLNTGTGIAPGIQIVPTTTAGRIAARTTAIDTFFRIFGKMLDTNPPNKAAIALINVR